MKVAITTVQAPFISGGAELHASNLKKALINCGHEAEIVTIPFMDSPLSLIENYIVAARLMNLTHSWAGPIDLCIGLKFPAYLIPHPNKVIWALHQHRGAYDLFDTPFTNLRNEKEGRHIRSVIKNADTLYMQEAKRLYANSQNVANRLKEYNNLDSTPLYHPCPDMEQFTDGSYGNYILMPSRINITKRQLLAVEALQHTNSGIQLYIMGKADHPDEKNKLVQRVNELGLSSRVKFLEFVPQEEKFKLYANARAILFIPQDEDYGYITLEGMASSKAVITASDSGGPLEFVIDGDNGFVCDPSPLSVAQAIDTLGKDKNTAKIMGKKAKQRLKDMNISWEYVVKELTRS